MASYNNFTILTVGEGGAGGSMVSPGGGGGGSGGQVLESTYEMTVGSFDVVVGSGGGSFGNDSYIGSPSFNILVVAGGGGGGGTGDGTGSGWAGGGGGGGVVSKTTIWLPEGTLNIVVGQGGNGGAGGTPEQNGANGTDSSLGNIKAAGGGGGGAASDGGGSKGGNGGSGGGGGKGNTGSSNGKGLAVPGQGNAGGIGFRVSGSSGGNAGGGGGGAGSAGVDGSGSNPIHSVGGNGGAGLSSSISGASLDYGSGGGGFGDDVAGAAGGAGAGAQSTSATARGGGGGGAGGTNGTGGDGADGIVVIRFPTAAITVVSSTNATITTDGSDTIYTWTADGTFQFTYNADALPYARGGAPGGSGNSVFSTGTSSSSAGGWSHTGGGGGSVYLDSGDFAGFVDGGDGAFAGGDGQFASSGGDWRGGGGGAGANGNGGNGSGSSPGGGGSGVSSSILGTPITFGAGGQGSEGTGAPIGTPGAANTGTGGTAGSPGAIGGSGIVVISYPTGAVYATGGTKAVIGGNTVHAFTTNGTFSFLVGFTNPTAVFTSDNSYATAASGSADVAVTLSKDGGANFSVARTITLTGSEASHTVGSGETELFGTTWVGADVDDTSFRLKIQSGDYAQVYGDFDFSVPATRTILGIKVVIEGLFTGGEVKIDHLTVTMYHGNSATPINAGSVAFASDGRKNGEGAGSGTGVLVFFDGNDWFAVDSGQIVQD